jgi:hypothetical protein
MMAKRQQTFQRAARKRKALQRAKAEHRADKAAAETETAAAEPETAEPKPKKSKQADDTAEA